MFRDDRTSNAVRKLLFILTLLMFPHAVCGQTDMVVYDDALRNTWQSYGWATLNYANTTPVHGGNASIQVTDPTTSYQALYLHRNQFSTANYESLRFWVYVTTGAAQPLMVQALRLGSAQTGVRPTGLTVNGWTQVTISLSSLGVSNVNDFDGFWIQNVTGAPLTFYVDDITLVATPPPAQLTITVDAATTVRTIDNRLFGLNTAVWDSQLGSSANSSLLADAGARILRYPGGSLSDDYNWHTDRGVTNGSFTWASSTSTFLKMAESLAAQSCITVNYGSGTPEQAAAWVAYCNATSSNSTVLGVDSMGRDWETAGWWASLRGAAPLGADDGYNFLRISHPTPFGVTWWEVGNECYGSWEKDLHGVSGSGLTGVANDPYTYAQAFPLFAAKMHAVDASIHIGMPATPGQDSYGNGTHAVPNPNQGNALHSGWTPVVLANLKAQGAKPAFIVDHIYPQQPGSEDDAYLLQSSSLAESDAANLRTMITDYYGAGGGTIELQVTELNSVTFNPGKQSVSLVNGLFFADMSARMATTEFGACMWWDLRNGSDSGQNNSAALYGWRQFGDYGLVAAGDRPDTPVNTPYPSFYASKLMTHWGRGGDTVVATTTNHSLLSAYAARLTDGRLALLVINKSPTTDDDVLISLNGFQPGSANATMYRYGKSNDTASSDLTTSALSNAASTFSVTFPAYSMSVIVLDGPTGFAVWQSHNFNAGELSDSSISGPAADPDHHGISNLMRYALGMTRLSPTSTGLPVVGLETVGGNTYGSFSFTKPATNSDITYTVEVSEDLQTWHSGDSWIVRVDDGTTDQAHYRAVASLAGTPRQFYRLVVTTP